MNDDLENCPMTGLSAWLPKLEQVDDDFWGMNISADEKKGWKEGRESFQQWYRQLTLWERIKKAFKGELI